MRALTRARARTPPRAPRAMATVLGPPPPFGLPWPDDEGEGLVDELGVGGLEVEAGELAFRQLVSSEAPTSLTSDEPPEQGY
jgi:hypothetical protein